MGRASSLAAANAVSARARRRTFWAIRVVGRSPAVWIAGNSSASMPLMWVWNRPGLQVERLAGRDLELDLVAGRQRVDEVRQELGRDGRRPVLVDLARNPVGDPISRLVAVSLSPASSVLSRTLASTGSVLRLETARLTTDRPRARFSCMTESLTSGSLQLGRVRAVAAARVPVGSSAMGRGCPEPVSVGRGYLLSIFSLRHHRHNAVDRGMALVDVRSAGGSTEARPWMAERRGQWWAGGGRAASSGSPVAAGDRPQVTGAGCPRRATAHVDHHPSHRFGEDDRDRGAERPSRSGG